MSNKKRYRQKSKNNRVFISTPKKLRTESFEELETRYYELNLKDNFQNGSIDQIDFRYGEKETYKEQGSEVKAKVDMSSSWKNLKGKISTDANALYDAILSFALQRKIDINKRDIEMIDNFAMEYFLNSENPLTAEKKNKK